MISSPHISHLRYTPATTADERKGLLGFVSCHYGALVLDGIALRRSADGRLLLAWPGRRDTHGKQHHSVRPVDDAARVALESAVFAELKLRTEAEV